MNNILQGVKRSILYDFSNKMEDLKRTIIAANDPAVEEAMQKRGILATLPAKTVEEFLCLEIKLGETEEMAAAMVCISVYLLQTKQNRITLM